MATQRRTANVTWQGTLTEGSGTITSTSTGAFGNLPVTWKARTESADGMTSPEELIAAAHASCYAMGLTHGLAQSGTPATQIDVSATCSLEIGESGPVITSMEFDVKGKVDGIDQSGFEEAARGAADSCPVSGALKGNLDIRVNAQLV